MLCWDHLTSPCIHKVRQVSSGPKQPSRKSSKSAVRHVRHRKRLDPWTPRRRNPSKTGPKPLPQRPVRKYTCRICACSQPLTSFITPMPPSRLLNTSRTEIPCPCYPHLTGSSRLKKDPVCKTCIGRYMVSRLETVGARNVGVGCLEPGCKNQWHHDFIMHYLPPDALEDYCHGMLKVWAEDNPTVTCPNEACGALGFLEPKKTPGYPQVVCADCYLRMCAVCKDPWHEGQSCAEYWSSKAKKTNSEQDTLRLLHSKDARRCPGCSLVIEKIGGCDSMQCAGCSRYFIWGQGGDVITGAIRPQSQFSVPGAVDSVVCEVDADITMVD